MGRRQDWEWQRITGTACLSGPFLSVTRSTQDGISETSNSNNSVYVVIIVIIVCICLSVCLSSLVCVVGYFYVR